MAATFDDGILTIYTTENIGEPGMKPVIGLVEKEKYYYGFDTLGINRFYTALQAKQQIESVVNIPGWNNIAATDICALDDGTQFRIVMRQPTFDEDRLRITKLSLERMDEQYVIKTEDNPGDSKNGD